MEAIEAIDEDNLDRGDSFGVAAAMIAAAHLDSNTAGALASEAVPSKTAPSSLGTSACFGPHARRWPLHQESLDAFE
jgi:hypothetical protein